MIRMKDYRLNLPKVLSKDMRCVYIHAGSAKLIAELWVLYWIQLWETTITKTIHPWYQKKRGRKLKREEFSYILTLPLLYYFVRHLKILQW